MATSFLSAIGSAVKKASGALIWEIAGGVAFLAGVAQLLHHAAIAACVIGGAAAFLAGKKLRAKAA